MKKMRTRLLSLLLVLVTVLSLLPTSALAASSTGTGIKPTSNTNYWTTRLLHDGTPYSYKPPMAAGKMLYCMDRGYGYRWGTPSFLNSYTYAVRYEGHTDLTPYEFFECCNEKSDDEILGAAVQYYDVVEIDDGIKPAFFYKTEHGYELLFSFDAKTAKKNIREEID